MIVTSFKVYPEFRTSNEWRDVCDDPFDDKTLADVTLAATQYVH